MTELLTVTTDDFLELIEDNGFYFDESDLGEKTLSDDSKRKFKDILSQLN